MIIDVHSYVLGSNELYRQKANLVAERGWGDSFGPPDPAVVAHYADLTIKYFGSTGVDVRLIGPRPYHLMQAERPASIVHRWIGLYNDVIFTQCGMYPDKLKPVVGLPQVAGEPIDVCLDELDRCAALGAVGVQVNPDPGERAIATPGMGDEYWYPLWQRLEELDLPALIVSGATRWTRESYRMHYATEASIAVLSLLENERLFRDFPRLKLVIGCGGGSVPYQIGRWRARRLRRPELEPFDTSLRRLWFDTAVQAPASLALLIETVGVDRCLFGTTHPGGTSTINPTTGRSFDDIRPIIETLPGLTAQDHAAIFTSNPKRVFNRL